MTMLRPRQKIFVKRSLSALQKHGNTLGVAPTGCHAPGTPILMYDGTTKSVEEIAVGDPLMGPDSRPRNVLELHHGVDSLFEIRPLKGEPFTVNAGHILSLIKTNPSNDPGRQWGLPAGSIVDLSVVDYLSRSAHFKHLHKLYRSRVDFPPTSGLLLDPYFLGLLLGDGSLKYGSASITTMDFEVVAYCHAMAGQLGVGIREEQLAGNDANTYHFSVPGSARENPLTARLRALGVYGCGADEKFIPQAYKTGSRETRAAVLAGLIDTDGYRIKNGIEYSTASRQLAEDVAFVARSLGFLALPKPKPVNGKIYYRFAICGDFSEVPLRVARRKPGPRRQKKDPLRTGFTVHAADRGEYYGFTVDRDQRYLMGDFTVTHNSGKTIMLSGVAGEWLGDNDAKACVLAHRDELTSQNEAKFRRVNPGIETSVFDAREKSWSGQTTFAMVQTLSREVNLKRMPTLDLLVVDEAHHVAASSYRRIIDHARKRNPELALFGVTATPNRGDRKGLRPVFSNVADQITLGELIQSGHLVPPRTFVVDVGTQGALSGIRRSADDFDMAEVDAIMNRAPITEAVVRHWKERAGDRKTVVFCSTVNHARNVTEAFRASGIDAVMVYGELSNNARTEALARFEQGNVQVVVNVAVLTEGGITL